MHPTGKTLVAAGRHTIPHRITGVILALLALSGCATVEYYAQSVSGHLRLMARAQPIENILHSGEAPAALREQLRLALELRRFASTALGLPDNASYTRYARIDRPYVVWNVFAAPVLSTAAHRWCFPVVGCVAYRGYYDPDDAAAYAAGLRSDGLDAAVAGIPAYSTLGWFDDPLPSSVIGFPEERLAGLLFHELSHQVVYVKHDAAFNESFATVVELEGTRRWFQARGDAAAAARHRAMNARDRRVARLALSYRGRLQAVYDTGAGEAWKHARKRELFAALSEEYAAMVAADAALAGYEDWFDGEPNNARLVPFATYHRHVAAFEALLARHGGDLPAFYAAVARLGALAPAQREAQLGALAASAAGAQPDAAR